MGCGPSKELALSVHPTTQKGTPRTQSASTDPKLVRRNAPQSASTLEPSMMCNNALSKPQSAHPIDPSTRSDSGIGTRGSARSNKTLDLKTILPSILTGSSVVATNGGGASANNGSNDEQLEIHLKPTSFEIPIEDSVRVRSRKPSAGPRNRRRTQLQPMANLSNSEVNKKLELAQLRWEEGALLTVKDKDLDPDVLRELTLQRDQRVAINRERELLEKKTKLQIHEAHIREVAERKLRLVNAQQQEFVSQNGFGSGNETDLPQLHLV